MVDQSATSTAHLSRQQLDALTELGLDLAVEGWAPKAFPNLAAPGQLFAPERYTERFAAMEADLARGFRGVTTDGRVIPGLFPIRDSGVSSLPIRRAAQAFLNSLTPEQRLRALLPIDALDWQRWHGLFTRLLRHGVPLEEMTSPQKQAALDLLRVTLSQRGFEAMEAIRRTNDLAGKVSGRFMDLGEDQFWVSVMGDPADQAWGWQIDGHHINLNCFVLGDQMVMTPAYLGAEPTRIRSGRYAGLRLFAEEEADALALILSLSENQRRQAVLDTELRPEVFTGAFRDNFEMRYEGTPVREFSSDQTQSLIRLIEDFAGYMRDGHSTRRLEEVGRHLEQTHFAWMGGYRNDDAFYYRVHSPVILIEFTHMPGISLVGDEPSRLHVHTVVRTPNGNDYGKDLLRQHMERSHGASARLNDIGGPF